MVNFTELLTASDADLVKIFCKITPDPSDFIKNLNQIANKLKLNHAQLVCAIGFNKNIRDLTDILTVLGFKSYKVVVYRRNELFTTDTYQQLSIDNILDIYSERPEDQDILDNLRSLIIPRLHHIEGDMEKSSDPSLTISYRMEIHSIYQSGITNKPFAEKRLKKDSKAYRFLANEVIEMVKANIFPPSNFLFMECVSPDEKRQLIESNYIEHNMIKNRLQNTAISAAERDMLEDFI